MGRHLTLPARRPPAFMRYRLTWTHSHEWPQEPRSGLLAPYTFGHLIAVVSAGVVLGLLGWIFVVGLLTVAG